MTGPASSPATLKPKIGLTAEQVIELAYHGLREGVDPRSVRDLLADWLQAAKDARKEKSENSFASAPKTE